MAEVFLAERGSGYDGGSAEYLGAAIAQTDGRFYFWSNLPVGRTICVLASSALHNTSAFSSNVTILGMSVSTPNATSTQTAIPSSSATPIFTPTPTASHPATPPFSPTPTVTISLTPTCTPTPQLIQTVTNEFTVALSQTPDLTQTFTPSPEFDPQHFKDRWVQPYPNPASHQVAFAFAQGKQGQVKISIYNLSGDLIAEVSGRLLGQSGQTMVWNTRVVPPGIYLAQVWLDGVPLEKIKIAIRK